MRIIIIVLVFCASHLAALGQMPPTAESLPAINVLCWRSFVASTMDPILGVIIDIDYSGQPRFQLLTVDGTVLKVIYYPSSPGSRKEYGKFASEVNRSAIADPAKRPPIFAWEEETKIGKEVYSFRLDDKLLSRTSISKSRQGLTVSTEVLKCK